MFLLLQSHEFGLSHAGLSRQVLTGGLLSIFLSQLHQLPLKVTVIDRIVVITHLVILSLLKLNSFLHHLLSLSGLHLGLRCH